MVYVITLRYVINSVMLFVKLYTGQGFLSDLIAPYLYYPIGVLQNMNTEHANSQLNDIFPRSFLKNRRVASRRPLY